MALRGVKDLQPIICITPVSPLFVNIVRVQHMRYIPLKPSLTQIFYISGCGSAPVKTNLVSHCVDHNLVGVVDERNQ